MRNYLRFLYATDIKLISQCKDGLVTIHADITLLLLNNNKYNINHSFSFLHKSIHIFPRKKNESTTFKHYFWKI